MASDRRIPPGIELESIWSRNYIMHDGARLRWSRRPWYVIDAVEGGAHRLYPLLNLAEISMVAGVVATTFSQGLGRPAHLLPSILEDAARDMHATSRNMRVWSFGMSTMFNKTRVSLGHELVTLLETHEVLLRVPPWALGKDGRGGLLQLDRGTLDTWRATASVIVAAADDEACT